ncbi:hypothetical protein JIN84_00615 [Luteolibacter yonseiensis]|uniref:Uncharacterized protein n=1 Tax=Luteolibacter yonseiensis TaxID=1144680 RepID=A0A934QZT7_9BACT|nr:hypothetical protein [Luteolibacter yonseiensis]MBK1814109.1 hypothetical protein [Luteolibacter yonseiensis]
MKTQPTATARRCSARRPRRTHPRGFALIVTLSLMILLAVIAVGLLSLAGVTLRNSGQNNAMSVARANARMALMLAIGELQKNAGPDQRITARADILDDRIANPRLTGVWDSWEMTPNTQPSEFQKTARDAKFRGWLVSGDPLESRKIGFASEATPAVTGPASQSAPGVTLWGTGTVGKNNTSPNAASNEVAVNKVPINSTPGALAWAVMDEGVKVRINNLFTKDVAGVTTREGTKTSRLGAGRLPGVAFIDDLEGLERKFFETGKEEAKEIMKGVTPRSFSLAAKKVASGVDQEKLMALTHDITTVSTGLFTDVARGGLKQDFQLMTNSTTLPSEYTTGTNKGIYASRFSSLPAGVKSDPQWESLRQFASTYKDTANLTKTNGVPVLKTRVPAAWNASVQNGTPGEPGSSITVKPEPPAGVVLTPTIAKVQMLFSLIARDLYPNLPANIQRRLTTAEKAGNLHGPQDAYFRSTKYDYDLHLLYTPIVTLHNPYNVALEFTNLRLEFIGVPFAMQVFRNGAPLSKGLVPLETMTDDNKNGQKSKVFGMNLKTKVGGKVGAPVFRMLPGEVILFSPYIDPTRNYAQDLGSRTFWDIELATGITKSIDAIPGWRGFGIGYDCDWLAGNQPSFGSASSETPGSAEPPYGLWKGCYGLAWDDKIHVEFAPISIPANNNKFTIQLSATVAGTANKKITAIEMDYSEPKGLQKFLSPTGGETALRYPGGDLAKNYVVGHEMREPSSTPIGQLQKAKAFALLTVQAKNTSGGIDATNVDGRYNGKPWAFAHGAVATSSQKILKEHPANQSHEIDLRLLPESELAEFPAIEKNTDRASFITGNSNFNGTKFGVLYDVPLAPVQTLAGLNGANPGGSSGYLPRFAQPIGNSWAHPLLSTDKIHESGPNGYSYLDHSFLLNLALYDGFYFSGFADQTGNFGTAGRTAKAMADEFVKESSLDDARIHVLPPSGKAMTDLPNVVTDAAGYKQIASWETMDGSFNVNSTSVLAWKAMLASIHEEEALINTRANPSDISTRLIDLKPTKTGEARISRFRLPGSNSAENGATPTDGFWLGPREYSDDELQDLAQNIVKQVRLRGPFLSMAEFVNRRLGPASDDMSQRGALQQAIDDTKSGNKLLNEKLLDGGNVKSGYEIPAGTSVKYGYKNPKAGEGPSYQGAPGYLTQADILNVLGNAATVRSDTFTIRAYGEARSPAGMMLASATCEAVVQRMPDWVDKAADAVDTSVAALASNANKNFGRRFTLTSFRWLNRDEI